MKRKKVLYIFAFLIIGAGLLLGHQWFLKPGGTISKKQLDAYVATQDYYSRIAKSAVNAAGGKYTKEMQPEIKVYYGDITGDGQDEALLAVSISPKLSYLVVYTLQRNTYTCLESLGPFFAVNEVQFVPVSGRKEQVVLIREYIDQLQEAFEEDTYIRGLLWDGNEFDTVLTMNEKSRAYWQDLWNGLTAKQWRRISQTAETVWEGGGSPVIRVNYQQSQSTSDVFTDTIPSDDSFNVVKTNTVALSYYWSYDYNHFILYEGVYMPTGAKVAIIEDLNDSPYYWDAKSPKIRIKTKEGEVMLVERELVTAVKDTLALPIDVASASLMYE